MEQLIKFKKAIISLIIIIAAVAAAAALALGAVSTAKGLVLGSLFSLLNFLIMAIQTPGRIGQSRRAATVSSGSGLFLRLAIMAVAPYVAIQVPAISLPATVAGLFNLQVSVIVYSTIIERFGPIGGPTV
jgi:hypothetical protein